MNYLHEVVEISQGRRLSEIFTTEGPVDNHGIQWRGVCNNTFYYTFTVEKKIMMKKARKETWLDLNSALLGCKE